MDASSIACGTTQVPVGQVLKSKDVWDTLHKASQRHDATPLMKDTFGGAIPFPTDRISPGESERISTARDVFAQLMHDELVAAAEGVYRDVHDASFRTLLDCLRHGDGSRNEAQAALLLGAFQDADNSIYLDKLITVLLDDL